MPGNTSYADDYRDIDFRKHPEKYRIGKGEQGVLIAEPYKSEILSHWKFATPEAAQTSAKKIYAMFCEYRSAKDFVGMDMARKFLQMGFTRSRRYANHAPGRKYNNDGTTKPQGSLSESSPKAESAKISYQNYQKAKSDEVYKQLKARHVQYFEKPPTPARPIKRTPMRLSLFFRNSSETSIEPSKIVRPTTINEVSIKVCSGEHT